MDFQFNFDIEPDEVEEQEDKQAEPSCNKNKELAEAEVECKNVDEPRPAKEIIVPSTLPSHEPSVVDALKVGDLELFFLNPTEVEIERRLDTIENSTSTDVSRAVESHSDLIPNVYEGGLKVWECSIDLVHFLHEAEVRLKNERVLELGCGAGLPGIYAVKRGAASVHFQDYNEEVIEHMTIPSVLLNQSEDSSAIQDFRFFAGDWSFVQDKLVTSSPTTKYDVILTSETIYCLESQDKLYKILSALLSPEGVIYIAAKTHYFGVGGGTRIFEDMVKRRGEFHIEVCKAFSQGVNREILKMEFLKTPKDL